MTEAEWLASTDPTPMLEFLRGKASDRKLRLFASSCCRQSWRYIPDSASRRAVEVSELFADRKVRAAKLSAAASEANEVASSIAHEALITMTSSKYAEKDGAYGAARCAARTIDAEQVGRLAWLASPRPRSNQCALLRDNFGNPFRPSPPLPPAVLAWNDRTVPRLAQAAYEERHLPEGTLDPGRLAILADALLDAGCEDDSLIQHCREPGPHVRGCWAVDLLLGKE
jgi:hypothetical protein